MNWTFETLDKNIPYDNYYNLAYNWYCNSPMFLRSISEFIEDRNKFVDSLKGCLNFSGKIQNEVKAIIHGEDIE
jgi:hypothetical protein